jgi:hypothetical protein
MTSLTCWILLDFGICGEIRVCFFFLFYIRLYHRFNVTDPSCCRLKPLLTHTRPRFDRARFDIIMIYQFHYTTCQLPGQWAPVRASAYTSEGVDIAIPWYRAACSPFDPRTTASTPITGVYLASRRSITSTRRMRSPGRIGAWLICK